MLEASPSSVLVVCSLILPPDRLRFLKGTTAASFFRSDRVLAGFVRARYPRSPPRLPIWKLAPLVSASPARLPPKVPPPTSSPWSVSDLLGNADEDWVNRLLRTKLRASFVRLPCGLWFLPGSMDFGLNRSNRSLG